MKIIIPVHPFQILSCSAIKRKFNNTIKIYGRINYDIRQDRVGIEPYEIEIIE